MNEKCRIQQQHNICFIGAGRAARSLGLYFLKKGLKICGYYSKTFLHAQQAAEQIGCSAFKTVEQTTQANIIIIATPDDSIAEISSALCRLESINWQDKIVCHLSGAHSSKLLQPLYDEGAAIASLHPPFTFDTISTEFPDISFVLEGQNINGFKNFLISKDIKYIEIDADKKRLYHVAAVFSSNYITTLLSVSHDMLKEIGFSDCCDIFSHLAEAAVANTIRKGAAALTGPIIRGDFNTLKAHVEELEKYDNNWLKLYKALAQQTANLAGKSIYLTGGD